MTIPESDRMSDYLRLAQMYGLGPKLRGRPNFDKIENPDFSNTATLPPEPSMLDESEDLGNFDVRANQIKSPELMPPTAGDRSTMSQLYQGINGMKSAEGISEVPALSNNNQENIQSPGFFDTWYNQVGKNNKFKEDEVGNYTKPFTNLASGLISYLDKSILHGPEQGALNDARKTINKYTGLGKFGEYADEAVLDSFSNKPIDYETAVALQKKHDPEVLERRPEIKQKIMNSIVQGPLETSKNQSIDANLAKAAENPGRVVVPGATQIVSEDPVLSDSFREITGQDLTPEIAEIVSNYEAALADPMKNLEDSQTSLSEMEQKIRDRLNSGSLTTEDKIFMGIALIMPLIVGGLIGGKGGFLGALAGGAQGFTQGLLADEERMRTDEGTLQSIAKDRAAIGTKQAELASLPAKLKQDLQKNLPKDARTEALEGRRERTFNLKDGRTVSGIEIEPGLYKESRFVQNKHDKERAEKQADEISAAKNAVEELYEMSGNVIDLASTITNPSLFSKILNAKLTGTAIDINPAMGTMVDFHGRKVNSAIELQQQLGLLVDAYRIMKEQKGLTKTIADHVSSIFDNPFKSFNTPQDTINQMLSLRELAQGRLVAHAKNSGFIPEALQSYLHNKNKQTQGTLDNKANQDRLNKIERGL